MNHVMPVAVYLATKFWMYFTWFFYLMPCILWCWHHIGAINTGEHFQAELEILCVHLGVPRGCELCSTLLWSRANHSSHSFFFPFFFFCGPSWKWELVHSDSFLYILAVFPACGEGMHKCEGSKRCIFLQFVCDGENDCLNGSDESEDNCLSEYFVFTSYCDLG